MNLAIFISGTGTTLNAIASAIESGRLKSKITVVISNKTDAPGLKNYAEPRSLPIEIVPSRDKTEEQFGRDLIDAVQKHNADFICLCGFLKKIPPNFIECFRGKIINSHPGDTKKYGGPGMYGLKVHEAVLRAGEQETMSTIHFVDEVYDHGEIISQMKMPITPDIKTPEKLAARLLPIEWENYISTLEKLEKES